MPDHFHLLATLGHRLPLGKCIARLKSKTKPALRDTVPTVEWERGFYDHHLRPEDDRLAVFRYLFLNPYRAGLCLRGDRWPWYYCRKEDWQWFKDLLEIERPSPEWLL